MDNAGTLTRTSGDDTSKRGFRQHWLPLLFFTIIAILFTFPLIIRIHDSLPGKGSDPYQFLWFAWWDGEALFHRLVSPFHTPLIFHPTGSHVNGEPIPFSIVFGMLSNALPVVPAYNILYLLNYVFAAFGCYLLSLYFTKSRSAGIVAGLIYGFSPFMMAKGFGHLNVMSNGFIPLFLLSLFKGTESADFRPGQALLGGMWLGLTMLTSSYFTVFFALYLPGFFLFLFLRKRLLPSMKFLTVVMFTGGVMFLPQFLQMLGAIGEGYYRNVSGLGSAILTSADLSGYIVPHDLHPVWGEWSRNAFSSVGVGSVDRTASLGLVPLALIVAAWFWRAKNWQSIWIWTSTAGAFLLSLGPFLQIGGRMTYLPLPGLGLVTMPIIGNARAAGRWGVLVTLGAALLAGWAYSRLKEHDWGRRNWRWLAIAIPLGIVFEYLPSPYPLIPAKTPAILSQLPFDPLHPAVLDLPVGRSDGLKRFGSFDNRQLLYQTVHKRPIVGGYVLRMRQAQLERLEHGVPGRLIEIQDKYAAKPDSVSRRSHLKQRLKELVEGNRIAGWLASLFIGREKLKSYLEPEKAYELTVSDSITPESARAELDSLGIGLILASGIDKPGVASGVEYLSRLVPLKFIGRDGDLAVYSIEYNR